MTRSPWRKRLLLAGLGLVLLVVVLVALAPTIAGALLPSRVEAAFAEQFHGRLEVDALELSWGGRQRVRDARLLDPEGAQVAQVDVELPGLWSLASGRGMRLGETRVVVALDLVTGTDGRSNLERALEPRSQVAPGPAPRDGGGDEEGGGLAALEGRAADVTVLVTRLGWRDEGSGRTVEAEELSLALVLDGRGGARVTGGGTLVGERPAQLALQLDVQHLFDAPQSQTPPEVALRLEVTDLPVGLVDALAGQGGLVREALGERATIALEANGTHQDGRVTLRVESEGADVSARALVENGLLAAREGYALEADLRLPKRLWDERVVPLLPAGVRLAPAGDVARLRATVSRLSLPLAQLVEAAASGADVAAAAATGSEMVIDLSLGDWSVADAGMSAPLDLRQLALAARLVPQGTLRRAELELRADVGASEGAGFELRANCADVAAALSAKHGAGTAPIGFALALRRLDSRLVVERLGEGPLAQVFGEQFDLALDVDGQLALGGATQARVALDLTTRGRRFDARLDVELPEGPAAAPLIARGEVGGLDLLRPLVPSPRRESFDELVGERLALDLSTSAMPGGGMLVSAKLAGARLELGAVVQQGPSGLRTHAEDGISLTLRPSDALLARELGANLPEGARIELLEPDAVLELALHDLEWPTVDVPEGEDALALTLSRASAQLELRLPGLRLITPAAAPDAAAVPVELGGLHAVAALVPESGLALTATSRLAGAEEDAIDLRVTVPRPAEWLAEDTSQAAFVVALRCRAIPTALVDAIAAQDGLVVDVLGATADVELDARRPGGEGSLRLALRSPTSKLDLVGDLDEGVLRSPAEGGLSATMPLTPLYTKRIVGNLLPMLVGLSKADGAPPAALEVTHFALPLDGDLSKLACDVHLDLNQVSYRLVPGFAELLAGAASGGGTKSFVVPPISLVVRDGRVTYDALPIDLGDTQLNLTGSFDLSTRAIDFATDLPLAALGDTVTSQLAGGKFGLEPTTRVPLRISGTPRKPKVSVPREFVEGLLKNAAQDAAKKGLGDLLEKALKKDG